MTASGLATGAMFVAAVAMLAPVACDPGPSESLATTTPTVAEHHIILRHRIFTPEPTVTPFLAAGQRHGILQFFDRPRDSLARLANLGITVHGFQRHDAYYVTVPAGVSASDLRGIGVRALFGLPPTDKLSPSARPPAHGEHETVTVSYASDKFRAHVARALGQLGAVVVRFGSPNLVVARASRTAVQALARREWVWWIEPATSEIGPLLDEALAAIRADEVQAPPWGSGVPGLTGAGVNVAMWEVDGVPDPDHPDFGSAAGGSRVSNGEAFMAIGSHATEVAGTFVGNGAASESEGGTAQQWAGVAPEAVLFAYDAMAGGGVSDEVAASFESNDTVVTNHSWGFSVNGPVDCSGVGAYTSHSAALDDMTTMIPVTSAIRP